MFQPTQLTRNRSKAMDDYLPRSSILNTNMRQISIDIGRRLSRHVSKVIHKWKSSGLK
jgi:hypothetical protein